MADLTQVVEKLAELTAQGKVPWKSTANPNSFAATIGRLSVVISGRVGLVASPFTDRIRLAVLDEEGRDIDHLDHDLGDPNNPGHGTRLPTLYQSAKRSALGVDQRLEELLSDLESVS
jgi:hypothetical protein